MTLVAVFVVWESGVGRMVSHRTGGLVASACPLLVASMDFGLARHRPYLGPEATAGANPPSTGRACSGVLRHLLVLYYN